MDAGLERAPRKRVLRTLTALGGVARVSSRDRLDVPPDSTFGFSEPSRLGNPANPGSGRGTRREAPALGPSRAGALPGKKGLSEDSPSGESGQSHKAPGKESREPDSVATRRFSPSTKGKTSKVAGAVEARSITKFSINKAPGKVFRDSAVARSFSLLNTGGISKVAEALGVRDSAKKSLSPSLPSVNILQGRRRSLEEEKRDKEVIDRQDKIQGKTSDLSNCLFKVKRRGSEGKLGKKYNNKPAPSLKAYFKTKPEDIALIPGQGKMDTYMIKDTRNDTDSGEGGMNDPPPSTNISAHQVDKQVGSDLILRQDGDLQEVLELLLPFVDIPTELLHPSLTALEPFIPSNEVLFEQVFALLDNSIQA
ncbi:hypothetical protein NDU88_006262 [Pleurodeles waltl]|uniref:Uncharacterized protein n=1 Tax=Pleurodeles waltl TaxID=8319 RepID=A0AAV7LRZ2_PLEWA|nr:hypothetical protein NDU88_006262 [Pleurodeles waltl]